MTIVFTIGHSRYTAEHFLWLLPAHTIGLSMCWRVLSRTVAHRAARGLLGAAHALTSSGSCTTLDDVPSEG
jgi:hypothetical protein